MRAYPRELRADFQQYYGLNLDGMGTDYSVAHAAILAAQLPNGSRLYKAINPDTQWDMSMALLNNIEYWLHWLVWAKTEDGHKGRNAPHPVWEPNRRDMAQGAAMDIEELEEFLSRPRREV